MDKNAKYKESARQDVLRALRESVARGWESLAKAPLGYMLVSKDGNSALTDKTRRVRFTHVPGGSVLEYGMAIRMRDRWNYVIEGEYHGNESLYVHLVDAKEALQKHISETEALIMEIENRTL